MRTMVRHVLALGLALAATPAFAVHDSIGEAGFDKSYYAMQGSDGAVKVMECVETDPVAYGRNVRAAYESTPTQRSQDGLTGTAVALDHQASRQLDAGG